MIRGNKYLHRVFYLVARNLEPFNGYYERLIARGGRVLNSPLVLLLESLPAFVITL